MINTVETVNSNMAASSGRLRPILSLMGPNTSCPRASPIMLVVSPSCTIVSWV